MAQPDDGDLATPSATSRGKKVREYFPITFDRPNHRANKDFRPLPVTDESPTMPPAETLEVKREVVNPDGSSAGMEPQPVPEPIEAKIELTPVTPHPSTLPPA